MKKITITILAFVLSQMFCNAQDIILKKSGEEVVVKVLEVGKTEITYKDIDDQAEQILTLEKAQIFMIRYENGTKDMFKDEDTNIQTSYSDEQLSEMGVQDAKRNYTGKKSGAGWTAATTILFTPLAGIIPAAGCASSRPADQNLNYSDVQLIEDSNYYQAYTEEAHKIKKKKVWKSFGISSGAWLLIILLL